MSPQQPSRRRTLQRMNRRIALAAAPLVLLAACSSGGGSSEPSTVTQTVTTSSTSSTSEGTPYGNDPSFKITDKQFLTKMKANLGEGAGDEQFRNLGKQVCKDLVAGQSVKSEIIALQGQTEYTDDQISYTVATSVRAYCTEYEEQVRELTTE